jgi:Leucine-rich repeat (LRR) protein
LIWCAATASELPPAAVNFGVTTNAFAPNASDHVGDVMALIDLYYAMGGHAGNLESNSRWLENGTSMCSWRGITCNCTAFPACRVTKISLEYDSTQKPLSTSQVPNSIGNLTALTQLHIQRGLLVGTLPSTIGQLVNLQALQISANRLTGAFPASISQCRLLQEISANTNQFTSFPHPLSNMSSLLTLNIHTQSGMRSPLQLQSCPPNLLSLKFSSIEYFDPLPSQGFKWLCGCTKLKELEFSGMNGTFPDWLGPCLPQLSALNVVNNNFIDSIPDSFCWLNQMEMLVVSYNTLRSPIPECIWNMSKIRTIDLTRNQLHSSIPSSLVKLTKLTRLKVSYNQLTGTIPLGLQSLTKLDTFQCTDNLLNGTLDALCGLPSLTMIDVTNNRLSGTISGNLSSVGFLFLSKNQFFGPLTPQLFDSNSRVKSFFADYNQFSGTLPEVEIFFMWELVLDSNRLSGTIPEWICSPPMMLNTLSLGNNLFTGTIPSCLGSTVVDSMTILNMSMNRLTGTLPPFLGGINNASSFFSLDLHGNELTGSVPNSFSWLSTLLFLDLSSNRLHGSFPPSLANLNSLLRVDISVNHFSGSLENLFQTATHFPSFLNVSYNSFSGKLTTLQGACNSSNSPPCLSADVFDARGNQFQCPMPEYNQLTMLFLRDACVPEYQTFFIYCGSLFALLLTGAAGRLLAIKFCAGSVASTDSTPSSITTRLKWIIFASSYFMSNATVASDAYTMVLIGKYLLSRIDNCQLMNLHSIWSSMPSVSTFSNLVQLTGDEPFPQYLHNWILKLYGVANKFDIYEADMMTQLNPLLDQFSANCFAIQSGCALRVSPDFPLPFLTECYMRDETQAPFGGTSHRGFFIWFIAIVGIRIIVELGRLAVVFISWHFRRIVYAEWTIDYVGSSTFSPLFVVALNGDWSEFFKVIVMHQSNHRELIARVFYQSLLCSIPLLCANVYFLFVVSQSGLQLSNMFSVLSALVTIPLNLIRAIRAWRESDKAYTTEELLHELELQKYADDSKPSISVI